MLIFDVFFTPGSTRPSGPHWLSRTTWSQGEEDGKTVSMVLLVQFEFSGGHRCPLRMLRTTTDHIYCSDKPLSNILQAMRVLCFPITPPSILQRFGEIALLILCRHGSVPFQSFPVYNRSKSQPECGDFNEAC